MSISDGETPASWKATGRLHSQFKFVFLLLYREKVGGLNFKPDNQTKKQFAFIRLGREDFFFFSPSFFINYPAMG